MKKTQIATLLLAFTQAIIWTLVLRASYAPERVEQAAMIAATALTAVAAVRPYRLLATVAQMGQTVALLIYVAVSVHWARTDGEAAAGLAMMIMSGGILLVVAPPVANLIALQLLKKSRPIQASHATSEPAPGAASSAREG